MKSPVQKDSEGILAYDTAMTLDPGPKMGGRGCLHLIYIGNSWPTAYGGRKARNEKDRATFLQLAKTWHEAALEIERGLGLISESEHLLQRSKREAPSPRPQAQGLPRKQA